MTATEARARRSLWDFDLPGRAWRFFTSVRLALVLILAVTAAVLAGTILMQAPPSAVADSEIYEQWLERARSKYGVWTGLLDDLQMFTVFHSFWFRLLIGLLTVNIIICSLNRWKGIFTTVFRARTRMGDAFFEHARFNARLETAMPAPAAAQRLTHTLRHSGYRVKSETADDSVAVYADRNRFSKFGTFLSHLSIILILVGAIIGGIWGYSDPEFIVAEGATRDLGQGTNISVGLDHFADEYYLDGPPKDFRSDLVIYDNGVEAKRGTIQVNSPMTYAGYRFHQSFFGQAAVIQVRDSDGALLFDEGVPLSWRSRDGNRPVGFFALPERNLDIYVIGSESGVNDPLIPAGEVRLETYGRDTGRLMTMENLSQGTPKQVEGLNFTFERERRFTGLKVVKDPGVNIIWVASALMIFGLAMLFYFPHRRLWALCKQRPDGTAEVRLATTAQRDMSLAQEFDRLRHRVRRALGIPLDSSHPAEGDSDV